VLRAHGEQAQFRRLEARAKSVLAEGVRPILPLPRRFMGPERKGLLEKVRTWHTPTATPVPRLERPPAPEIKPSKEPAPEKSWPWQKPPASQTPPKQAAELLSVPMICSETDRPFSLRFKETGGTSKRTFQLEQVITGIGTNGDKTAALAVPVDRIAWDGIYCPHCNAPCRPVYCNHCKRLGCDGRLTPTLDGLYYRCADSCGTSGMVAYQLRTINGSKDRDGAPQAPPGSPPTVALVPPRRSR
jgi:hypothetical protein